MWQLLRKRRNRGWLYEANFFLLFQIIHAADFKTLEFNACKESLCCGKHRRLTSSEVFILQLPINLHHAFTSGSRNPSALRVHNFHLCLVLLVRSHHSLCPSSPVRGSLTLSEACVCGNQDISVYLLLTESVFKQRCYVTVVIIIIIFVSQYVLFSFFVIDWKEWG